jgi:hypothetical protein
MKRIFHVAVTVLGLSAISWPALAGFVTKYSDWKNMEEGARRHYTQGLFDSSLVMIVDDMNSISTSTRLTKCGTSLGLTDQIISEEMTRYYEKNTKLWIYPPFVIFSNAIIYGVCNSYVNEERVKNGLFIVPSDI